MELVDNCGVQGLHKLYIYEHSIVSRLSWPFLVHNLSLSFVRDLDKYVISRLKRWAGLYRSADMARFFAPRPANDVAGTPLSANAGHKMLSFGELSDDKVRAIYENYRIQKQAHEKRWSGPKELASLEPIAEHNLRYAGQFGTAGLGIRKSDRYIAKPTAKERRNKITETLIAQHDEDHIRHPASCGKECGQPRRRSCRSNNLCPGPT